MDTTQILLTHPPRDAIVMMLNLKNGTSFAIDDIEVSAPEVLVGEDWNTKVTLKVRPSRGKNDILPYGNGGPIEFKYNRLNVAQHFNGVLGGFNVTLPTSTQILLDEITRRVGQAFVLDDIVLYDISRQNALVYELTAKAESLRWVGKMPLRVGNAIDLNAFMGSIAPPTLGPIGSTEAFASINAIRPYMNATAYQDELRALTVGQTPENGAALKPIFDAMVAFSNAPKYRQPLYRNGYFEDGGDGWAVYGTSAVNVGSITLTGSTLYPAAINRAITLSKGDLVEVIVSVDLNEFDVTSPRVVLVGSTGAISHSYDLVEAPGEGRLVGSRQFYFIAPSTGSFQLRFEVPAGASSDAKRVTISRMDAMLVPRTMTRYSAKSIGVNGSFTINGDGIFSYDAGVVSDRWFALDFTLDQELVSDAVVSLAFTDAPYSLSHPVLVPAGAGAVGKVYRALGCASGAGSISGNVVVTVAQNGVGSLVATKATVRPLPLMWNEGLFPSNDFVLPVYDGDIDVIDGAKGSVTFNDDGCVLTSNVSMNSEFGVTFKTSGIVSGECASVIASIPKGLNLDVAMTFNGAQIVEVTGSATLPWDQLASKRYTVPKTLAYRMALDYSGLQQAHQFSVTFKPRYQLTGNVVPVSFQTTIDTFDVRQVSANWEIVPTLVEYNLYGAKITEKEVQHTAAPNTVIRHLTHAYYFQLDPTKCSMVSEGSGYFSYVPKSFIVSDFERNSQLTRYGAATSEDGSYYSAQLNLLSVGDTIVVGTLPTTMYLDVLNPSSKWVVSSSPARKNLHGAIVQYNGPLRPSDYKSPVAGLNKVAALVLDSALCTGYKGVLRIYYRE